MSQTKYAITRRPEDLKVFESVPLAFMTENTTQRNLASDLVYELIKDMKVGELPQWLTVTLVDKQHVTGVYKVSIECNPHTHAVIFGE